MNWLIGDSGVRFALAESANGGGFMADSVGTKTAPEKSPGPIGVQDRSRNQVIAAAAMAARPAPRTEARAERIAAENAMTTPGRLWVFSTPARRGQGMLREFRRFIV